MSCTNSPAGAIPLNTPLRRFAVSFAPTLNHKVKIRENVGGVAYGWVGDDVLITEPGKTRGKWVVTVICRINEPGCWQAEGLNKFGERS